jgi:phage shock protein A
MALINRITRLFRADMHAVLDRLEEPDTLLKQAVREMEEEIAHDAQRLKLLRHQQGQASDRSADLTQNLTQIDAELDLCFAQRQTDLARSLVKRKIEAQRFNKMLQKKSETLVTDVRDLEQRLTENHARLQAMQQKLELLSEDLARSAGYDTGPAADISVCDDEVDVAFLREQQQRATP